MAVAAAGVYVYRSDTLTEVWSGSVQQGVECLAWSPDGKTLATGVAHEIVILWDAERGQQLLTLEYKTAPNGKAATVKSIAWSPDGGMLSFGAWDGTVPIWDTQSGELLQILEGDSSTIRKLSWSPDGLLASGDTQGKVNIWHVELGKLLHTEPGKVNNIKDLAWFNGDLLATGTYEKKIVIWNAETGKRLHSFEGYESWILRIVWSPEGERLAVGLADNTLVITDAESGEQLQVFEGHTLPAYNIAWVANSQQVTKHLVSGSLDGKLIKWHTETGAQLKVLNVHTDPIYSLAWSPDSTMLAIGSQNGLRVWAADNGKTGTLLHTFDDYSDPVSNLAWSPDGKYLTTGEWSDPAISLLNIKTGDKVRTFEGLTEENVLCVGFSPDGKHLAAGLSEGTLVIWETETGDLFQILKGHTKGIFALDWSSDGNFLASSSFDETIYIWDTTAWEQGLILDDLREMAFSVAWSPDGTQLASALRDATVVIWDPKTGDKIHKLEGHEARVESVSWSPDGLLASGAVNIGNVIVWDSETGQEIYRLEAHHDLVTWVSWSPDGSMLASGSLDGTVLVWDASLFTPPPIVTDTPGPTPTQILVGPFHQVGPVDIDLPGESWQKTLHAASNGELFLYTEESMIVFRDNNWDMYLSDFPGRIIGFDDDDRVWAFSEDTSEISVWDGTSWTHYGADKGWLPIGDCWWCSMQRSLHYDQEGRLWLATVEDIRVFDGTRWTVYSTEEIGLNPPEYEGDEYIDYHISILKEGSQVWVSGCHMMPIGPSLQGGVRWFDGTTWRGSNSPVANGCGGTISEDNVGRIWIGLGGDLWLYEPAANTWNRFTPPTPLPPLERHWYRRITGISFGPSNNPWVRFLLCGGAGCEGQTLLHHLKDGIWIQMVESTFEYIPGVKGILFDQQGTGWLFWGSVIYLLEGDDLDPIATLNTQQIAMDDDSIIWIIAWYEDQDVLWKLDQSLDK